MFRRSLLLLLAISYLFCADVATSQRPPPMATGPNGETMPPRPPQPPPMTTGPNGETMPPRPPQPPPMTTGPNGETMPPRPPQPPPMTTGPNGETMPPRPSRPSPLSPSLPTTHGSNDNLAGGGAQSKSDPLSGTATEVAPSAAHPSNRGLSKSSIAVIAICASVVIVVSVVAAVLVWRFHRIRCPANSPPIELRAVGETRASAPDTEVIGIVVADPVKGKPKSTEPCVNYAP